MSNLLCVAGLVVLGMLAVGGSAARAAVHPWEKQEITLTAEQKFANAYTDAVVWVDLTGPHFNKRVYGFWDGGQTFRVRVVATEAGAWTWKSGSTPADAGLAGKSGSFTATAWTEAELGANALRRGFLQPTANQHALQHADGTPFFIIGDTWYSLGTNRFKWYDDDTPRPMGRRRGSRTTCDIARSRGTTG